jgi:hypothetical protein
MTDAAKRSSGRGRPLLWSVLALLLYLLSWAPVLLWLDSHGYTRMMGYPRLKKVSGRVFSYPLDARLPDWATVFYWPLNMLQKNSPDFIQMQMLSYFGWWAELMGVTETGIID